MNKIKLDSVKTIVLNIYGTILSSTPENEFLYPRKGTSELIRKCKEKDISLIGTYRGKQTPEIDLEEWGLDTKAFDYFIELQKGKNSLFSILHSQEINPSEILVIEDSKKRNSRKFKKSKCNVIYVPHYDGVLDKYNISNLLD